MLIQKKLMANSFPEGANVIFPEGLTPYHIAESYCTVWVYVGSHAVCALPMLPVVLLGWEESGAEGRTAFVLGALGDVGFTIYDALKLTWRASVVPAPLCARHGVRLGFIGLGLGFGFGFIGLGLGIGIGFGFALGLGKGPAQEHVEGVALAPPCALTLTLTLTYP